ncbi:hypothetical protein HZR84_12870 [Hyphobacterium sp. CCMP332]|nr:hypothetical protein HZR84_12870 [Hyphobacterium sp. CCMP332]
MEKDRNYFENKFKDFKSAPPLTVWKDIESGLVLKERRKKAIFFVRIAAGLLLLITALWFTFSKSGIKENKLASEEIKNIERVEGKSNSELQPIIRNSIASIDSENQKKLIWPEKEIKTEQKINTDSKARRNVINDRNADKTELRTIKDLPFTDSIKNNTRPIEKIQQEAELKKPLLAKLENDSLQKNEHKREELLIADADIKNKAEEGSIDNGDAKSITIILRPKNRENLASNDNGSDEKSKFEQFRESLNKDLYKQTIRLGEVPDLAFNKLKLRSN